MNIDKNEMEIEKIGVFYHQLLIECQNVRKSVNQIERELGYPRNALHNYKNGRSPSSKRLLELSEYFDVSPKYLLGIEDSKTKSSIQEFFEGLNAFEKQEMSRFCHQWLMLQSFMINNG